MSIEKVESKGRRAFTKSWFSWGILLLVLFAWLAPELGRKNGPLHPEVLVRSGIVLVFLLHGLRLPFEALARGFTAWREHLLVQGIAFVLMPGCGWAVLQGLAEQLSEPLRVGFLYLAALPTTIASAVVLTGVARGNVALAIFSAAVSSLLAVVVTPLWMTLGTGSAASMANIEAMVVPLALMLVAPVGVGQLVRAAFVRFGPGVGAAPWKAPWVSRAAGLFERGVVLFIVYTVFCDAFSTGVFAQIRSVEIAMIGACCVGLLLVAMVASHALAHQLHLEKADVTAIAFSATTKSLAVGVPMALVIFRERADAALVLLPIMLYHPLQLLALGALASRLGDRERGDATRP